MEPKIKMDGNKFYRRIEKIYKLWKNEVISLHLKKEFVSFKCR